MAKASTPTLLSLDQYARVLGMHPIHFNSVVVPGIFPVVNAVSDFFYQYAWMDVGQLSREELGFAIGEAERLIAEALGYWPAPQWITNELRAFPQLDYIPNPEMLDAGRYGRHPAIIALEWGQFRHSGRRRVDVVALAEDVVYTDADGDGYFETATITIAGLPDTTGWTADEIFVFHDDNTSIENAIRPLRVTIGPGTVTIVGRREQFVKPHLWESGAKVDGRVIPDGPDPDMNFLLEVNVYRIYASIAGDAYAPIEFLLQDSSLAPPPYYVAQRGVMQVEMAEKSRIYAVPATWDAATAAWVTSYLRRRPDHIRCHYQAGFPLDANGWVSPVMARAIAALATGRMLIPMDPYGPPSNLMRHWQSVPENVAYAQLVCPWGSTNGAWEAYRIVTTTMSTIKGITV